MYYYLNEHKQVQGPFTAAEMRRLVKDGTIDARTPASEEGGSGWRALAEINLPEEAPAETLGGCPHCNAILKGAGVPPACPHCGKALHPGSENLWVNACHAFRQSFNYRGRATRREFWSFILFGTLLCMGLSSILKFLGDAPDFALAVEILFAVSVVAQVPAFIGVTVRRLHDTGHSGWWVLAPGAFVLLLIPLAVLVQTAPDSYIAMQMFMFAALLGVEGVNLFILVQMFLPSRRGPTRHGPSLLFPHG